MKKVSQALLASVAVLWCLTTTTTAASGGCTTLLENGVFDMYYRTVVNFNSASYKAALCSFDSTYSYNDYSTDYAAAESSSSSSSGSGGASFSLFGFIKIGGSGGGSSGSTKMSSSSFEERKTQILAEQASLCTSTATSVVDSGSITEISKTVNAALVDAYVQCIRAYQSGLEFTVHGEETSPLWTVDVTFRPSMASATAQLTGVTQTNNLMCTIIPAGSTPPFALQPLMTITVSCVRQDNGSIPAYAMVSTTMGTYMMFVPANPSVAVAPYMTELRQALSELASKDSTLASQTSTLARQNAQASTMLREARSSITNVTADVTALKGQANALATAVSTIRAQVSTLQNQPSALPLTSSRVAGKRFRFANAENYLGTMLLAADGSVQEYNGDNEKRWSITSRGYLQLLDGGGSSSCVFYFSVVGSNGKLVMWGPFRRSGSWQHFLSEV